MALQPFASGFVGEAALTDQLESSGPNGLEAVPPIEVRPHPRYNVIVVEVVSTVRFRREPRQELVVAALAAPRPPHSRPATCR
jgi:hypothetical protein